MFREFREHLDRAGRRQIACQLGKLESEVTEEDVARALENLRSEALRRTKLNFTVGCGGLILFLILSLILF